MGNFWLKIKVWSKLILFALIAIYVLFFVAQNSGKQATFWAFYHREYTSTVLVLVLVSFACGALAMLLFRTGVTTVRQIREIKDKNRAVKIEKQMADMQAKASKLVTKPADEPVRPSEP